MQVKPNNPNIDITLENSITVNRKIQARNQEFFRAAEFSWN